MATWQPILRLGHTPLALVLLAGCHPQLPPRQAPVSEVDPSPIPVRVVRSEGCCSGEPGRLVKEVEQVLARHPRVQVLVPPPAPAEPAIDARLEARTRELRAILRRVKDQYLRMQMEAVQSELHRALDAIRKHAGLYLEAEEIALVHLYLAAISQATGQPAQLRSHAEAAVRFYPQIKLDPDVFTPPVRAEVEKARAARRTVDVTIISEPAGARIFWDGRPRGKTPAELPGEALGEHYLRLQRSGHGNWQDTIVLSSASAQLRVSLPAGGPASSPASMLAADLLLISESGDGLRLGLQPRSGEPRTAHIAGRSGAAAVESVVSALISGKTEEPATRPAPVRPRSHLQRYWLAYVLGGVGVLAVVIALPAALAGSSSPDGRLVKLPLP